MMRIAILSFIALMLAIVFSLGARAEKIPTGYNSWRLEDRPGKHALEFGGPPANYWDGAKWSANSPRFVAASRGFQSILNRHFVHVDTISGIVRFAMRGPEGAVHIMRSRIGPLYLINRVTRDRRRLSDAALSGWRASGDTITLPEISTRVCDV